VKGKPVEITIACNAAKPAAQKQRDGDQRLRRCTRTRVAATGASVLPPAVMVSITSDPESDEVTKNTITRTMPMNDVMAGSGNA
jgi:hypothetical protein